MGHHSRLSLVKNNVIAIYKIALQDALTKRGKVITFSITIVTSLAILGYLIFSQRQVLTTINLDINPIYLILFCAFYIINFLLVTLIWEQILNTFDMHADFLQHLTSYAISNLAKRMPGTIWYIPIRSQIYEENIGLNTKFSLLSSGIELFLLIISSFVVVIAFSVERIFANNKNFIWILLSTFVFLLLLIIPWVRNKILGLFGQSEIQIPHTKFIKWVLIYVLTRIIGGSMLFCVAKLFYNLPIANITSIIGFHSFMALLSLFLFILPTNLGITEVGISLMLSTLMPSSFAVIVAIMNRLLVIVLDIFNGGVFWILFMKRPVHLTKRGY